MIRAAVEARQLERLEKVFRGARGRFASRASIARDLARGIRLIAERRVSTTKLDPDGRPWLPWSNSYARTRGAGHSLLVDTRTLLKSFVAQTSGAGRVRVWNRAPYSGYVQARRPFLGIGRLEQEFAERLVGKALARMIGL